MAHIPMRFVIMAALKLRGFGGAWGALLGMAVSRFTREREQGRRTAFDRAAGAALRTRPRSLPERPIPSSPPRQASDESAAPGLLDRPAELHGDRRGFVLRRWLLVADVAALCGALAFVQIFGGLVPSSNHYLTFDLVAFVIAVPTWLLLLRVYGLYHTDSQRADHAVSEEIAPVVQMTALSCWGLLLVCSATGFAPLSISRLALLWGAGFTLLLGFRAAARARARKQDWYRQSTLIVGTSAQSAALLAKIERHPEWGVDVIGYLELPDADGAHKADGNGTRAVGPAELTDSEAEVLRTVAELGVDRVLLSASAGALGEHSTLLSELGDRHVHVDLVPGWAETVGSRLEATEMEGTPLLTLPRTRIPRSSLLIKRLVDIAVSGSLLLVLAPLLALFALAIKLDSPGPVLFRQRRVGRAGRRFEILKFRSMHDGAAAKQHELIGLTLHPDASETGIFKVARDPRVTRVGSFLRRFSLDELPQLVNILRGDMSLVGPRPLPEDEAERITGRFRRRTDLMPGLTGLWQVHGRSNIPFGDMIVLDYLYVTNWSLWRDVKLLVRTIVVVVRARGAY
jgi:exopolysaccharide biosynthesis polyprenyl glycosylphosphotransferase